LKKGQPNKGLASFTYFVKPSVKPMADKEIQIVGIPGVQARQMFSKRFSLCG
jgi:hypothetical protein